MHLFALRIVVRIRSQPTLLYNSRGIAAVVNLGLLNTRHFESTVVIMVALCICNRETIYIYGRPM